MKLHEVRLRGLTQASDLIDAQDNRIIGLGAPQIGTDAARLLDVENLAGFYNNTVKQTDGLASFSGIKVWNYNSVDFYITQNDPNTDEFILNSKALKNVVDDPSPQLGGDLDTNGFDIVSASGVPIEIFPGGKGDGADLRLGDTDSAIIRLGKNTIFEADDSAFNSIKFKATGTASSDILFEMSTAARTITMSDPISGAVSIQGGPGFTMLAIGGDAKIQALTDDVVLAPPGGKNVIIDANTWPATDGSAGQILETDGAGILSFVDPPGKFYGSTVALTDDSVSFSNIQKFNFNATNFYITQNDPNTDEVGINLRDLPAAGSDGTLQFNNNGIIAATETADGVDNLRYDNSTGALLLTSFGSPNLANAVNTGTGIIVSATGVQLAVDGINKFNVAATTITIGSGIASFSMSTIPLINLAAPTANNDAVRLVDLQSAPGFYALTVKQTDDTASFSKIKVLSFNADHFYITQNAPNTDEVIIDLRQDFLPLTSKAITIESPTSSEDIGLFFTNEAITLTHIIGVCVGSSPSVTTDIKYNSDRSAAGTSALSAATAVTSTTTGTILPVGSGNVPAGNWVWLETSAQSGTVTNMTITLTYRQT